VLEEVAGGCCIHAIGLVGCLTIHVAGHGDRNHNIGLHLDQGNDINWLPDFAQQGTEDGYKDHERTAGDYRHTDEGRDKDGA